MVDYLQKSRELGESVRKILIIEWCKCNFPVKSLGVSKSRAWPSLAFRYIPLLNGTPLSFLPIYVSYLKREARSLLSCNVLCWDLSIHNPGAKLDQLD